MRTGRPDAARPRASRAARTGAGAGFSLVELLIAMTVGLVALTAAAALFASSSRARTELQKVAQMAESARYAQDVLTEDLRLAGFYGEMPRIPQATSLPDPCAVDAADLGWQPNGPLTVPAPLVGIDGGEAAPDCVADRLPNTDMIVVRRASTVAAPLALLDGTPHLQVSLCAADADPVAIGIAAGDFGLRRTDCTAPAPVRRLLVRIYYVSRCDGCARAGIPTLSRVDLDGASMRTTRLAEGIEDLQLDYGFDVDGDGTPDVFLPGRSGNAGAPDDDWANLVAVRVHLLARSVESPAGWIDDRTYRLGLRGSVGPFRDGFRRTVLSSTVRLNNPAGRRE
ncbi:MAG TPA: PilW family protein [Burkholderiaceae bacterium]|nr:PilW family protein [Burkholderiaceae bacterium]